MLQADTGRPDLHQADAPEADADLHGRVLPSLVRRHVHHMQIVQRLGPVAPPATTACGLTAPLSARVVLFQYLNM